jgi:hypothetical protein
MTAFPKHKYVRSNKLMRAYRMLPCQHCGANDGTVAGAHANSGAQHKGLGVKADDSSCASLCFTCHTAMDSGSKMTEQERKDMWDKAHVRTLRELALCGLWPKDVELPDYV